eukprot:COSAG06_NODE_1603_length_8956_cov_6.771029_5_plen_109_part_00
MAPPACCQTFHEWLPASNATSVIPCCWIRHNYIVGNRGASLQTVVPCIVDIIVRAETADIDMSMPTYSSAPATPERNCCCMGCGLTDMIISHGSRDTRASEPASGDVP